MNAALLQIPGKAVDGGNLRLGLLSIHHRQQVVEPAQLTQGRAGIMIVDFSHGIALRGDDIAIFNEHRPESQAEKNILFIYKLLGLLLVHLVVPAGKKQVPVLIHIAGVHQAVVHPAHHPVIHQGARLTVAIEIPAGGHHRIDALGHLRGHIELVRAELPAGEKAPELRRMGNFHLGKGIHAPVQHLLPGDCQDGFIQIPLHLGARHQGHLRGEIEALPLQQLPGRREIQLPGIVRLAEAAGVRLRGGQGVAVDAIHRLGAPHRFQSIGKATFQQGGGILLHRWTGRLRHPDPLGGAQQDRKGQRCGNNSGQSLKQVAKQGIACHEIPS